MFPFSFDNLISAFGLIINLILLNFAYKVFKNFDVKKQFHSKQLDIVSQLSSEISNTTFGNMMYRFSFNPKNEQTYRVADGFGTFNLYQFACLDYARYKYEKLFVQGSKIQELMPFLKYSTDPILPKSIAAHLRKLNKDLLWQPHVNVDSLSTNYVIFYPKKKNDSDLLEKIHFLYYENCSDFASDVFALRKSIVDWFEEYGAKDINI